MLTRFVSCLFVAAVCAAQEAADSEWRLVLTAQGPVRGYRDPASDVFGFYNIPYATAPTGPNKFKAPLPPPTWQEPLEAISRNIICPQTGTITTQLMQEDCLVANVLVPDTKDKNLPVVVLVHGGAFQNGNGENERTKHLVKDKNIISVSFNYRVGIHGFLCLGTPDAPGNAGMKDQVALLRWVNKNIARFGGNPEDVTIAGCSAGSAAVDLLMLSKTTKCLFNKIISDSGSSISSFAVQIDPIGKAQEQAKVLNFSNVNDIYALEEFYKTVPIELLLLDNSFPSQKDTGVVFAPCVERDTGVEMFLEEAPYYILKNKKYKKLPVIYGFANMEGLLRLSNFEEWKDGMNENFSDFLPGNLQFRNEEEKKNIAQIVKEFYFGDQPVNEDTILQYIDYHTDVNFAQAMLWSIDIQVGNGHNKIYLYQYSFVDESTSPVPYTNVRGAQHCAQQSGILDGAAGPGSSSYDENGLSPEFQNIKTIMREIWSNFITKGKPVLKNSLLPAWPPVSRHSSPHMSVGETLSLKGSLLEERTRFWDGIYARYYRAPAAPNPNRTNNQGHTNNCLKRNQHNALHALLYKI